MKVDYQPTQLIVETIRDAAEYEQLLATLGGMARNHQWWIGDALVYGEQRFGEEVAQYAEALGLEPKTCVNYRYVAAHVTPSRRRDDLSWSHHAEVARLHGDTQRTVLAQAAREHWSVQQLRDHVALAYPQTQPQLFNEDDGRLPERENIDVQKRLEQIELRWLDAEQPDNYGHRRRLTTDDVADVRWLLHIAKRLTRSGR